MTATRKGLRRGVQRARSVSLAISTEMRLRKGRSDWARWGDDAQLLEAWDRRTERLAALIPPGSRVIEFGAARRTLEAHLPPGCTYLPSDLVSRGAGTLVVDLNARPLPAFPDMDVAVFGGVLEYLHDVPGVLWHLRPTVQTVVGSYAVESGRGWAWRRRHGWVNDFSEPELQAALLRGGFYPVHEEDYDEGWARQRLFRLERQAVRQAIVRDPGGS